MEKKDINNADQEELKKVQQQYNDGADWLGVCSSVRNGVAAIFAFIIPMIAMRVGRKRTHMICLVTGGIGLIGIKGIQGCQGLPGNDTATCPASLSTVVYLPNQCLSTSLTYPTLACQSIELTQTTTL